MRHEYESPLPPPEIDLHQGTVWLFRGQGSQTIGMGKESYEAYPEARRFQAIIDGMAGRDLTSIRFNGPKDVLSLTENAQPLIYTDCFSNLYLGRSYQIGEYAQEPRIVAGHSFGQITAAVAAGCLGDYMREPEEVFKRGAQLVLERVKATKTACQHHPGGMVALNISENHKLSIGNKEITIELKQLLPDFGLDLCVVNNDEQVVIGGSEEALKVFSWLLAKQPKPPKSTRLRIEGPFHTSLMAEAARDFEPTVRQLVTQPPKIPIMSNITARPLTTIQEVQNELIDGLTSTVRWKDIIAYLDSQGMTKSVEIGITKLLSSFNEKTIGGIAAAVALAGIGFVVWNRFHPKE